MWFRHRFVVASTRLKLAIYYVETEETHFPTNEQLLEYFAHDVYRIRTRTERSAGYTGYNMFVPDFVPDVRADVRLSAIDRLQIGLVVVWQL